MRKFFITVIFLTISTLPFLPEAFPQASKTVTFNFTLPIGNEYGKNIPIKLEAPGTITVSVSSENQINMPEGRTLTANPLYAIIYRYDENTKLLENKNYKYFMNSLTISHTVDQNEFNIPSTYIIGVRNTNARVVANINLTISYPGKKLPQMIKLPANLKYSVPKKIKAAPLKAPKLKKVPQRPKLPAKKMNIKMK